MEKLLVIDDDAQYLEGIVELLRIQGYEVYSAWDGRQGIELYKLIKPDLILLDFHLFDMSGADVAREIRAEDKKTPIIMLTCDSSDEIRQLSYESYINNFVLKIIKIKELTTIINNLILLNKAVWEHNIFKSEDLLIDYDNRLVFLYGEQIDFPKLEFDILALLTKNAGKTLEYNFIMETLFEEKYQGDIETLRTEIKRIRQKLRDDPKNPKYIDCIFNVGYCFLKKQ